MKYLTEITRIVDGAVKGDQAKVLAYVEQLARKISEEGDAKAAERLQRTASYIRASELATSGVGVAPAVPVDSESRLPLADETRIKPEEVEVVLEPVIEQRVAEFIRYVKAADRLLASHVGIAPSMIIFGPPGVGKTELARHVAAQLELPLVTARTDSLISSFLGSTAKNLRTLFEHAARRPCVLFLDELDSLAKLRDDQHELGELKRVVVSLLQNIDALGTQAVLLGATNHHHLLDPAIWRRFAYRIEMRAPELEARYRLFQLFLGRYAPEKEIAAFASVAEGLMGADIRQTCENAIREAILARRRSANPAHVLRGLVRFRLGEMLDFNPKDQGQMRTVQELAPGVLTCERVAALFGVSGATVSRRLKSRGMKDGGRETKTSNQGRGSARARPRKRAGRRR